MKRSILSLPVLNERYQLGFWVSSSSPGHCLPPSVQIPVQNLDFGQLFVVKDRSANPPKLRGDGGDTVQQSECSQTTSNHTLLTSNQESFAKLTLHYYSKEVGEASTKRKEEGKKSSLR